MMEIEVLKQIPDDIALEQICAFVRHAFKQHMLEGIGTICSRLTAEMFKTHFKSPLILISKKEQSTEICGVLILTGNPHGYIEAIAVAPAYQRQHIGNSLLRAAEQIVKERNGSFLLSDTSVLMRNSILWHKKNGFHKIALTSYRSTDYYSYILRKDLHPSWDRNIYYALRFFLSSIRTRLTKTPLRTVDEKDRLTLSEIQQMSLEIMEKVHRFCESNDIKYTLGYGSLIGAIRHRGFIPWDDDIDIIMPREDYERFLKIFACEGLDVFSSHRKDSYILYSRVFDTMKTFCRTKFPFARRYAGGVWIDIFPADAVEDDYNAFATKIHQLEQMYKRQMYLRDPKASILLMPTIKKKIGLIIRKIIRKNGAGLEENNTAMQKIMTSLEYGTMHWSQMACMDEGVKMYQLAEDFENTVLVPFEGHSFRILSGYDRVLRNIYGNYMELPPVNEQVSHQQFLDFYWNR